MLPRPAVLRNLVGDLRQVASVRRFVLAEGAETGVETLAVSTGGGLDFWVAAGRMLDIATLSWRGMQLGWQSPAGLRPPAADSDGRRFNYGFGGFLNSCGFDHIRQPADGLPLHGSAPFTPARLTAYGEVWDAEEPRLFCEGEIVAWAYGGGGYRLHRRIEAPIGGSGLRIRDSVAPVGPDPLPVLALYHFNLGYPLIGDGTETLLDGKRVGAPLTTPEREAVPPSLRRADGDRATCRVEGAAAWVEFCWRTDTLPWLQLWRDLRPGVGVLSVEPCSVGRAVDGANEGSPPLAPGESRDFAIDVTVGDAPANPART